MDERRLADAVDQVEVRQLQDAYADTVSRREWQALDDIIRHDAVIELDLRDRTLTFTGPGEIGRFIGESIAQFQFFQFGILGTRTLLRSDGDPDRAGSRMYMTELRQTHAGQWSQIHGVYHDSLARIDDRWWITHRRYHSLARHNVPPLLFDFPDHLRVDSL